MSELFENLICAWVRTAEEISIRAAPTVRSALEGIQGVRSAKISRSAREVDVCFDLNRVNLSQFERALFAAGFTLDVIIVRFDRHAKRRRALLSEGSASL
jgi:copper chaperone CopZ